jgi:phosphate transport system substrate-binding protein
MRRWQGAALVAATALLGLWVPHPAHARRTAVRVMGATSVTGLLTDAAAQFMARHPDISVHVTAGGSVAGLAAVLNGRADLGAADLRPEWVGLGSPRLVSRSLGCFPVVPIVHPGTGVAAVTREQLRRLLAGRVVSWQELGGTGANVVVVTRAPGSGARAVVDRAVMQGLAFSPRAVVQLSNGAVYRTVASTPGAIGFVEAGFVRPGVVPLRVDGVGFRRPAWPLVAPVGLYWRRGAPAAVAALAGFVATRPDLDRYGLEPCGQISRGADHGPRTKLGTAGGGRAGRHAAGADGVERLRPGGPRRPLRTGAGLAG